MGPLSRRQFLAASSLAATSAALAPRAFADRNDVRQRRRHRRPRPGHGSRQGAPGPQGRRRSPPSATSTRTSSARPSKDVEERSGNGAQVRTRTSARCSTTSRSTSSRSPRRTTGTPWPPIWAMQAGKDVYVEKPVSHNVCEGRRDRRGRPQVQPDRARPARSAAASTGMQRARSSSCTSGKLGKVYMARGLCYKPRGSIGQQGRRARSRRTIDYDLWSARRPNAPFNAQPVPLRLALVLGLRQRRPGQPGHPPDGHRPLGPGQEPSLPKAVVSLGGRFGYDDDGETPNTQIVRLRLRRLRSSIFEVRGLPTNDRARRQGRQPSSTAPRASWSISELHHAAWPSAPRRREVHPAVRRAAATTSATSSRPSAARKPASTSTADIEEGHLSSALCHLGNISYRLGGLHASTRSGRSATTRTRPTRTTGKEHLKTTASSPTRRRLRRPALTFDPKAETFTTIEADKMLTREYRKPFVVPAAV